MARRTKLTELMVKETSGVDHPAHLHEGWLVMKSSDLSTAFDEATTTKETDVDLEPTPALTNEPADIEKAAQHEAVLKELSDLRKALDDARKETDDLRKQRELEKAVDVANNWSNLPEMNPAEFAPVLCAIRESMPLEATIIEKVLEASSRALKESGILKELGTTASNDSVSAWDMIESQANSLVESGKAESFAKAVSIVASTNKDLYSKYIQEKGN